MDSNANILEKWGFSLQELYRLALEFYKQNSGKAIHLSYEDNLKLIAFKQQASLGPFDPKHAPELGVLDVIGRDRRLHWQMLGDINQETAMEGFIDSLDIMCNKFRPYIEAVRKNRDVTLKDELKRIEEEKLERGKCQLQQQELLEENYKEEMQRRHLQDTLNKQTYQQFKAYAERQFPDNPEKQAVFVLQLQQEHYHHYMQQSHLKNPHIVDSKSNHVNNTKTDGTYNENSLNIEQKLQQEWRNELAELSLYKKCEPLLPLSIASPLSLLQQQTVVCSNEDYVSIKPAKIWTRPDIEKFKADVSAEDGDSVLTVAHGDTITVRVPTNTNGKCIFWEFATDNYDIGFGIYFEWSKPTTQEVTVHISDSDDDDEFLDEDFLSSNEDLESGSLANEHISMTNNSIMKPPISIIVPIYRRECFNEVYVGSHVYPGEGVYLLKFDNSYSIWRSKTLYYRIYYER